MTRRPPDAERGPRRGPAAPERTTTAGPQRLYTGAVTAEGDQPSLLDLLTQDESQDRPRTIARQYEDFLSVNAWVVDEVAHRARQAKARGISKYGIRAILEPIRWHRVVELGEDASGFRLNNNVMSRLARDVMERCPDLADFFEVRSLRSQ